MQITFLVGNGFDISCGVKSSYSDFYKWYCTQEKSELEHVNKFREAIDSDIKAGKKNWADFEEALGQYTINFTKDSVQEFIDCYEDAHSNLMKYLKNEISRYEYTLSKAAKRNIIDGLLNFYSELSNPECDLFKELFQNDKSSKNILQFISFNYTDVLDKIILTVADNFSGQIYFRGNYYDYRKLIIEPAILHVHGKLTMYPIFGVNDKTQIENKELINTSNFPILMIKPESANATRKKWREEALKKIEDSQVLCLYGMSLGKTDALWFLSIINWLKSNNTRHLIIYWHTNAPSGGQFIWRHKQAESEAISKILSYDLSTNRDDIIDRIHVIENTEKVLRVKLQRKTFWTFLKKKYKEFFYLGY